ncbi:hypothetical protein [Myceligenerans crystallogenes]|uniref:Uncharacterized protein n=1 Tax=Myceligenerans crystallogenes TaxID=316335 RepID=A0ABP4ZNY3_9MICO
MSLIRRSLRFDGCIQADREQINLLGMHKDGIAVAYHAVDAGPVDLLVAAPRWFVDAYLAAVGHDRTVRTSGAGSPDPWMQNYEHPAAELRDLASRTAILVPRWQPHKGWPPPGVSRAIRSHDPWQSDRHVAGYPIAGDAFMG